MFDKLKSIVQNNSKSNQEAIFDLENKLFTGRILAINGFMYIYERLGDNYINKSLFYALLGNNFDGDISDIVERAQKVEEKLTNLIYEYAQYIEQIDEIESPSSRLLIYKKSLKEMQIITKLVINSLPFELEKAGVNLNMSIEEIDSRVDVNEDLEKVLFGDMIRDNPYEYNISYKYLVDNYNQNKDKLTKDEQSQYLDHLQKIKSKINYKEPILKLKKELEKSEILSKMIPRDDYIEIFRLVLDIYTINKKIIVDSVDNISAGGVIFIPNSSDYDYLSLERVLSLISHEIETHMITEKNNARYLGELSGAGFIPREEGLAIVSESILRGEDYDIKQTSRLSTILAGEILYGDEFRDFLRLNNKLNGLSRGDGELLRKKRNYPLNYRGVQHRDALYSRGISKIIEFIGNNGDIKDLYLGKVDFEDMKQIKVEKEKLNMKFHYPMLIGELLKYKLEGNKLTRDNFLQYLSKKYPFIDFNRELDDGVIKELTISNKKKILEIIEIVKI